MNREIEFAQDLINFIYGCPGPFHVVDSIKQLLADAGFEQLKLTGRWNLKTGGKYFIIKNDSALVAFQIGSGKLHEHGFRILASHTDSPSFRIKPAPELVIENRYLMLNTEVYGSPILNTWMDKPLSIAGRVCLQSENSFHPERRLVKFDQPVLIIPNQAIHMNRQLNDGVELNKQVDLLPLLGCVNREFEKRGFLVKLLAEKLNVDPDKIIDFDLFLHEYDRGQIVGLHNEFISSTRMDDLAMVHAQLHALLDKDDTAATAVFVCYDNEEVGNHTQQGAATVMLRNTLERIALSQGLDRSDFFSALYSSFMISADMGHAVHPNAASRHDPTSRPVLNGGPIIKYAANKGFLTDSDSGAVFETICKENNVPVQKFVNRSDVRGGTTFGAIASTHLDIRSIDIGSPLLAMHSIRELGGVQDHLYIWKAFRGFMSK